MKRRKGIRWEYNLDGQSHYERVKGFWKKYWRRWSKRQLGLLLLSFTLLLGVAHGGQELSDKDRAEYYRLGSTLLYKQLLAANERIKELETKLEIKRLEKEATDALMEMAKFRQRELGDARCTIDEKDSSVKCPAGVKKPYDDISPITDDDVPFPF